MKLKQPPFYEFESDGPWSMGHISQYALRQYAAGYLPPSAEDHLIK